MAASPSSLRGAPAWWVRLGGRGAAVLPAPRGRVQGSDPVVSFASWPVRLGHVVLVLGGWVVFAWLWLRVLGRPGTTEAIWSSLRLLAGLAAGTAVVTWAWIVHNVALARRRDGRRSSPPLVLPHDDLLGRRLEVAADVHHAPLVVVRVDGTTKHFLTGAASDE